MSTLDLDLLLSLPASERIRLAEVLWNSVAKDASNVDLPSWQADLLDARMADFERDPEEGISLEELKRQVIRTK